MPSSSPSSTAVQVFYSYAHKDEGLRSELAKHLKGLDRRGLIEAWHDHEILAGAEWASEISEHLESAHIILLLISADFINSEYAYGVELKRAMERHHAKEATVIPIILRPVNWQGMSFSKLQALPTHGKAVTTWADLDEAFSDIVRGIEAAIERLSAGPPRFSSLLNIKPNIPELLPYLCDRSDQERELSMALREHQQQKPRRPFICFIHGDQRECHSEFLKRMQHTAITSVLNLKQTQLSVEEYRLQWSTNIKSASLERIFWSYLGEALIENSAATKDEILEFIAPHEKPLLITSRLLTEDFATGGTEVLSAFIRFWSDWPDLPPGRVLIVCLCLKYQETDKMFFMRRWKLSRMNEQLRRFICDFDSQDCPGLHGVALPELEAIRQGDVLAWIHSKPVRTFCNVGEREVRALFSRAELCTPEGHISMESLADELRNLLHRSSH